MELYTLNSDLERTGVVDVFESLIWTDRYQDLGDFKITVPRDLRPGQTPSQNKTFKDIFEESPLVACNTSNRLMFVENIIDGVNEEGKKILSVSGTSAEKILANRVAKNALGGLTASPTWNITGVPAAIARYIFDQICVEGILDEADIIPLYTPGNFYPEDTIAEPVDEIDLQIPPKSVYDAIRDICAVYDLGFRLVRHPYTGAIYFNIYTGRNRTSAQNTDAPVVFSPQLDNLTNTQELKSIEFQKTGAYVFSNLNCETVYAEGIDETTIGINRKMMMVDATDLAEDDDISANLIQRGKMALGENRGMFAFDGEIRQQNSYRYGIDYNVGDLIEQRDATGFRNYMRVVEQIMTSDAEGERSYPTFSKNLTVTPGSWAGWDFNDEWEDHEPIDTPEDDWANQP